jgi:transcriptional antiterminator RfaH
VPDKLRLRTDIARTSLPVYESPRWFAVHTKPGAEQVAAAYISHLGVESFLPEIDEPSSNRKHLLRKPLFPGYLFARFCPMSHLRAVRYARGVRYVVSAGEIPLPVEEGVIALLRQRISLDACSEAREPEFHYGQEMLICDGALVGMRGLFERKVSSRRRVSLLLNTIHYQARIWIDSRSLGSAKQVC